MNSKKMTLTLEEQKRKKAALTIVKTLHSDYSVVARPLCSVNVKNIPDNAEPTIRQYIRGLDQHEVYGSAAMATHSFTARTPADLDIVVENPKQMASAVTRILRTKKHKTKIRANSKWNSYVVMVQHGNTWKDAVDIHPIKAHQGGTHDLWGAPQSPLTKNDINVQRASDQLQRKFNAVTLIRQDGTLGGIPKRELKDTVDAITTADMLITSAEVRNTADDARIVKAKSALRTWKQHLNKLKGSKTRKARIKRKPLNPAKKKRYVKYAVERTDVELDCIAFHSPTKLHTRALTSKTKKKTKRKTKTKRAKK